MEFKKDKIYKHRTGFEYRILDCKDNNAIIERLNIKDDPTPYVRVTNLDIDKEKWDSGTYYSNLEIAIHEFNNVFAVETDLFDIYRRMKSMDREYLVKLYICSLLGKENIEFEGNEKDLDRLYSVIYSAYEHWKETEITLDRIVGDISKAYLEDKITLDNLEAAHETDVLDCVIGLNDFETLEEEYGEQENR